MKPGMAWIGMVVGLLLLSVFIQGALVVAAMRDPSFAVEPDYERKAADWDASQRQAAASRALGWTVDLGTGPSEQPGAAVVFVEAYDEHGKPLRGAEVDVEAFHIARASDVVRGRLGRAGDGRYEAALPLARSGLWELRLTIRQGERVFVDTHRESVLSVPDFSRESR